ncbi:MAG: TolC family protein [Bacteriovoracaceae bacterium]|nr:TolC family protein [Bacteroidota bacterium]
MKKILAIALISLVLTAATAAQEKMSLQLAIQTALEKNIDVISSNNSRKISEANVTSAFGDFLPTLSASANIGREGATFDPNLKIPSGITAGGSTSAGLNADIILFNGFRNFTSYNSANVSAEAAVLNFAKQKQTTVLAVEQAYLTVLRNEQLLKVSQDNLKRSQQQLSRIEESNKVGAVAKADVYRQQVQTANDELAVINAQSDYDISKQNLLFSLAIDVTKDYVFEDATVLHQIESLNFDSLRQEYADYTKLVQEALDARPDYQASLLSKKISENDLTVARSGHYPTLKLGAGYGISGDNFGTISDTKSWDWRLSLSVPIFSGFQTSTQTQTSQLNLELAEQKVDEAKRRVAKDVRTALLNLETARKVYDVSLKAVTSAEEDRRIAEERYNLGSNTLLDLLVATTNYTQAISKKVSSSYDFVYAKLQFRIAVGREKY